MARRVFTIGVVAILALLSVQTFAQFRNYGRGIDLKRGLFDGVLGGTVIGLSNNEGKRWYNPIARAEQNLPDQLEVSPTTGVAIVTRGYDIKEFTDYVKEEHRWSSFKIGFFGLGFGKSKEAGTVQSLLQEGGSTVFVAERNFQLYDVASYPYDLLDMPARNRFIDSVNQLPSTCGTDAERSAYRQTIGFYGTHYFTQATYGGQMKYLISTKNSYVHRKTMSYIIKQVSFFIGILDFGLKFSSGSNTTEIRIDEEFLQMSTVTLVLNGGTHQFDGLTIRQWLSTVIASPSVIRAALRPLDELVNDDAKASCLSQAIQAYMGDANDNMGKRSVEGNPLRHTIGAADALRWAVRNSEVGAKRRSVVSELGLESATPGSLPGSHWIGMAIDAATGMPQVLPALRTTRNKPITDCSSVAKCGGCWTNPFVGQSYRIPDQVCFKPTPEFLMVNASQEITKLENLKYFYEKVTKKKGFLGLSSKTETYRRTIENQYKRNEALSYFYVFLSWYEISLPPPFPPPAPHPVFQAHYQSLPPTWNPDKNSYEFKAYARFLDYWGTHYVDSASVGGSMKQETWYHKCFLSATDEEYRNKQKKSSFIIATKRKGETVETETVDQKWSEYSRQTIDFQGGRAFDFDVDEWRDWLGTIYENPAPIHYGMTELSTLLPSGPVKTSLSQAIQAYLSESEIEAQNYPLQFANIQNNERPEWCNA